LFSKKRAGWSKAWRSDHAAIKNCTPIDVNAFTFILDAVVKEIYQHSRQKQKALARVLGTL